MPGGSDFEDAARSPYRELTDEEIFARRSAAHRGHAARDAPPPRLLSTCPSCEDGGKVVPFDGNGQGVVTVWRCIACSKNFPR